MDRRTFLGTAAGAGAIAWVGHYFLGRPAWAGPDDEPGRKAVEQIGNVAEAFAIANIHGKPLLVFVIPEKDELKRSRGQAFGSLLNHGGKDVYLDLALCEIACAMVADLRKRLKNFEVTGEPLMVLVEPGVDSVAVTTIDPTLPSASKDFAKADEVAQQRLEALAAAIHKVVSPDKAALLKRAARAEEKLPAEDRAVLRATLAGKIRPTDGIYLTGAAIVRAAAEDAQHPQPGLADALADAEKRRVTGLPPAGAKWAKSEGCGEEVEGEAPLGIDCGMAYVPKIAQRFLWFFTK